MPPTVLIADDDEALRNMVKRLLGEAARVVGETPDGEEAVRLACELKPDVVLLDIDLPVVDGLAATRRIKAVRPATRVILLTAHDEEAYLSATGKSGADAFLPKRHVRSGVLSAVRSALGGFAGRWNGRERRGRGGSGRSSWDGRERRKSGTSSEPGPDQAH